MAFALSEIRGYLKYQNSLQENQRRRVLPKRNTIFLSHSHEDADIILPMINFLLSQGISIYVDWLDEEMPKSTSGQTANRIKTKIVECRRFVVLLTENSKDSKWVPWELGFADGKKEIKDIAILPVRKSQFTHSSVFGGLEYMSLYPIIEEGTLKASKSQVPAIFPPARLGGSPRLLGSDWLDRQEVNFD